jgi:hypothetical protein
LDEAGRFSPAKFPDGRLRFKSRYKYDDAGHLLEETQSAEDGTLLHKIVYSYDAQGKQTGYSVFDASGKLVGGKSVAKSQPASSHKAREQAAR